MRAIVRRSAGLRVIQVLAVLLVGLVLAACGGSASQILSTVGAPIEQPAASQAPAAEVDGSGQMPDRSGSESGEVPLAAPRDDLKIVYTGSLQLVVDDLAGALARGKAAVLPVPRPNWALAWRWASK